MFWHGLSLVSSRVQRDSMVIQRERNIGQFERVLGDGRHHRSMDCSFHWKSNSVFALITLWIRHGRSVAAQMLNLCLWKPDFVGQVDFC